MSLAGDASILAVSDDDIWTIDFGFDNPMSDIADFRDTVSHRKARFWRIDTDIIGTWIFADEVVPHIGAVGLSVDGKEARR